MFLHTLLVFRPRSQLTEQADKRNYISNQRQQNTT